MRVEVFAGPSYDPSSLQKVGVNSEDDGIVAIDSEHCFAKVGVRIRDWHDINGTKLSSAYFEQSQHKDDQLSIQFSVKFREPVDGNNLMWGNDFDSPIRDILPPAFSMGLRMFKWIVDPSVEGDVYSDKPYLYGRALTSINRIRQDSERHEGRVEWAGFFNQEKLKDTEYVGSERMKHYMIEDERKQFEFGTIDTWDFDFYTPYLSMGDSFAIKLPMFGFDVSRYAAGQPLRYTLKNLETGAIYLVVVFRLIGDEANEDTTSTAENTPEVDDVNDVNDVD
jgi:hypothetical protein